MKFDPDKFAAGLAQIIKPLERRLAELETRCAELQTRNAELQTRCAGLEAAAQPLRHRDAYCPGDPCQKGDLVHHKSHFWGAVADTRTVPPSPDWKLLVRNCQ
jgi:hypothetical protein